MTKRIKYFHELTEKEFKALVKKHPHMTNQEFAKLYPQPPWCDYPDATYGMMGCWSLCSFMVKDKKYCKGCECLIHASGKGGK